jgi:hypothetical protein
MFARSPSRWARDSFALFTFFFFSADLLANVWRDEVGQSWFYETRQWSGEVVAGTWWADGLAPGKSYRISFEVGELRGRMALLLGDKDAITIDQPGRYAYDFYVRQDGKRRMIFRAETKNVLASVNHIDVQAESGSGTTRPDSDGSSSAEGNIWKNSFGQQWFYEVRKSAGEVLAGTWSESALTPGNTYKITFNVKSLKGRIGVLVGGNPAIEITKTGWYSYEFTVSEDGQRRLLFRTLSNDVVASVNEIWVTRGLSSPHGGSGGSAAKGHYISFDRERNLETDMLNLVREPYRARSNYHLNIARKLDAALRTPGVKGVWMEFNWRSLEVGDGKYNWKVLDDNVETMRKYGLKFIVEVADRSFDGSNVLPTYFPSAYVLWSSGGGKHGVVARRWDPWVYNRLIRLHKAIAHRYADDAGFGGIATAETATGYSGGDYTVRKYRQALTQVVTQSQAAMTNGKFFFYLNFLRGGDRSDMNKDQRVALLKDVPHGKLVIGAPDITPDVRGMPRSATNYRIHVRKHMPEVEQFCHMQNVDQGLGGINVKSNKYRTQYYDEIARVRSRERDYWFKGTPAVFHLDDLRDPNGNKVALHPNWVLGDRWSLDELFHYGRRNFDCDYVFWHYREHPRSSEFGWPDVKPVILNNQYFYE